MDNQTLLTVIGGILVALISGLSAIAAQRSASNAAKASTTTASRIEAEKEAYERARKFDIETITRQDAEIEELRTKVEKLEGEKDQLKKRVDHLEKEVNDHERKER